jgi:hypothetical protein
MLTQERPDSSQILISNGFGRWKTLLRSIPSKVVCRPGETGEEDLPTVSRISSSRSGL